MRAQNPSTKVYQRTNSARKSPLRRRPDEMVPINYAEAQSLGSSAGQSDPSVDRVTSGPIKPDESEGRFW
jgi:hypothetical protein